MSNQGMELAKNMQVVPADQSGPQQSKLFPPGTPLPGSSQTDTVVVVERESSPMKTVYSVFHLVVSVFAIYLSFKCNSGFDFGAFLMACCCPYIYVIYKFATSDNFCGIRG
jgi:hypothetical protein